VAGNVVVCATSACNGVLTYRSIALLLGVTVDPQGNVWASVSTNHTNASLVVWKNGKMPGSIVSGYRNPDSAGLEFANDGTLLSIDPLAAGVYAYSCEARKAACHETGHWPLKHEAFFGKLDKSNSQFQVAVNDPGQVDVYKYPGLVYQYSYRNGLGPSENVDGIAAFPL